MQELLRGKGLSKTLISKASTLLWRHTVLTRSGRSKERYLPRSRQAVFSRRSIHDAEAPERRHGYVYRFQEIRESQGKSDPPEVSHPLLLATIYTKNRDFCPLITLPKINIIL